MKHTRMADNFGKSDKIIEQERLCNFLIDDLKQVEYHIQQIIENIYARGLNEDYKKEIEEIEKFFSYWKYHSQFEKETEIKNQ